MSVSLTNLDELMAEHITDRGAGFSLAVLKNGELFHLNGYGLANIEWNISITGSTVFKIASLSKPLTATAIFLLKERGQLSIDNLITDYLPEFHTSGHDVTLRHLLTHTSGIYNHTASDEFWNERLYQSMIAEDIARSISTRAFAFKPGTQYAYSNSNYLLLAMVIERVSGKDYGTYLKEAIFEPLDMNATCNLSRLCIIPRLASGYMQDIETQQMIPARQIDDTLFFGAGSIASSGGDMARFMHAFTQGEILSADTMAEMSTETILPDGRPTGYGLGWSVSEFEGKRVISHRGMVPGYNAFGGWFPDDDLTIILLSNTSDYIKAPYVAAIAARHLLNLPALNKRPFILMGAMLERYVGDYVSDDGTPIKISISPESHILYGFGKTASRLIPRNRYEFYDADNPEMSFKFSELVDDVYKVCEITYPFSTPLRVTRI